MIKLSLPYLIIEALLLVDILSLIKRKVYTQLIRDMGQAYKAIKVKQTGTYVWRLYP